MDFNQVSARGLRRMMRNVMRKVEGGRFSGCGADWALEDFCAV